MQNAMRGYDKLMSRLRSGTKRKLLKIIALFFKLESSVQLLKHCYSLPANRKLTSFKIIESKFSNEEIITFFAVISCVWFLS